eukprot:247990-Amphidinium_carterae.1
MKSSLFVLLCLRLTLNTETSSALGYQDQALRAKHAKQIGPPFQPFTKNLARSTCMPIYGVADQHGGAFR